MTPQPSLFDDQPAPIDAANTTGRAPWEDPNTQPGEDWFATLLRPRPEGAG